MFAVSPTMADERDAPDYKVRVLLVDDQLIIIEAVRRMLAGHSDIEFHAVSDPHAARATAATSGCCVAMQGRARKIFC
jgi:two-component system chemotaxis family response regulator WspR